MTVSNTRSYLQREYILQMSSSSCNIPCNPVVQGSHLQIIHSIPFNISVEHTINQALSNNIVFQFHGFHFRDRKQLCSLGSPRRQQKVLDFRNEKNKTCAFKKLDVIFHIHCPSEKKNRRCIDAGNTRFIIVVFGKQLIMFWLL